MPLREQVWLAQWLEAWSPPHDDDAALIVQDDVTVSPLYYQWVKRSLESYHWPESEEEFNQDPPGSDEPP